MFLMFGFISLWFFLFLGEKWNVSESFDHEENSDTQRNHWVSIHTTKGNEEIYQM